MHYGLQAEFQGISTNTELSSPSGDSTKNTLYKLFFKKGWFIFYSIIIVLSLVLAIPTSAHASFFSDIFNFFAGKSVHSSSSSDSSVAADISSPLLGTNQSSQFAGVGGPIGNITQLPSSDGSALIATRNPLGVDASQNQGQIIVYAVEDGDTLGGIADKFGISLNTLLWANNLNKNSTINPRDQLVILPISGIQYDVKKGDTIESIAKKFNGEPTDILSFNGLAIGQDLTVGESIIIPDGELVLPSNQPTHHDNGHFRSERKEYAYLPATGIILNYPDLPGYFIRPIDGGLKSQDLHGWNAVDLANSCGLPIYAAASGEVIIARTFGWNGGYGEYVAIMHPNGVETLYAHMSKVFVYSGEQVSQGEVIGHIGTSGNSTGCHVHFEIRGAKNPF